MVCAAACLTGLGLMTYLQPGRGISPSAFAQTPQAVTVTNAADFSELKLTTNSIATAFGTFTTVDGQGYSATSLPLPKTLGGVRATVNGVAVDLLYVGPTQINFIIPGGIQLGEATIIVTSSDGTMKSGKFPVVAAEPGIFSSNFTGMGAAAAETTVDGRNYARTGNLDGTPTDVVLETGDNARPTYLVLYGTGVRNAPAANPNDTDGVAEAVKVTIQGIPAQVTYAGAQGAGAPGSFAGLDQINVIIPKELAGFGVVNVQVSIIGMNAVSNKVTIKLAGQRTPIRTTDIAPGQTLSGTLSLDDQILQNKVTGETYFFDAYRFTATAGTSVEIDMRSAQVDSVVLLYRIENGQLGTYLGADDQGGAFGQGKLEVNGNALMLTVVPTTSEYVILVSSYNQAETGAYTIKLTTNNVTPISYGSTVGGSITTTDLKTEAGVYLDAYALNITKGDRVQITMRSTAFDAFLQLRKMHDEDSGDEVAYDDNTGGGTDAQITTNPNDAKITTGLYVIVCTPLAVNVTGNYTLTVTKLSSLTGEQSVMELQPVRLPAREVTSTESARRRASMLNFALRRPVERNE